MWSLKGGNDTEIFLVTLLLSCCPQTLVSDQIADLWHENSGAKCKMCSEPRQRLHLDPLLLVVCQEKVLWCNFVKFNEFRFCPEVAIEHCFNLTLQPFWCISNILTSHYEHWNCEHPKFKSRILSVIPWTRQEPTKGARTRAVTLLYTVNVKCSNFLLMLGRVFRFSEVCISIGQVLEHVEQSTQSRHYRYLPRPEPCHALLTSYRGWNITILFQSLDLKKGYMHLYYHRETLQEEQALLMIKIDIRNETFLVGIYLIFKIHILTYWKMNKLALL